MCCIWYSHTHMFVPYSKFQVCTLMKISVQSELLTYFPYLFLINFLLKVNVEKYWEIFTVIGDSKRHFIILSFCLMNTILQPFVEISELGIH